MPDIVHEIVLQATADRVWWAIATAEGLSQWWTAEAQAKPEVGFVNVFLFDGQARTDMKVISLIPNKRVEWACIGGLEEWIGTTVSFDLEPQNDTTSLRFTHASWQAETDFFAVCKNHWAVYMESLKALLETGKGMPYGSIEFQRAVG